MYSILISIVLAIYSLILIDFTLLFQEMSVNADMITSTQALYTAEGAAEESMSNVSTKDRASRNIIFLREKEIDGNNQNDTYLSYNEMSNAFYFNRRMNLDNADLNIADALNENNRIVKSGGYAEIGQISYKVIYGLEPRRAQGFVLREVDVENNFNEIAFEYNLGNERSDLLFEVFAFPREGSDIDFLDFEQIKNGFDSSVKRIVINTKDSSLNGRSFETDIQSLVVYFNGSDGNYKNQVRISGFQPINRNYILHFQTLDNQPIHFRISAFFQNQPVMLPNLLQTVDVIGATSTGLYQRVKVQRQTEEGILPGLNFTHFSDGPIHK